MAKAAASHTESALADLSTSGPKAPDNELKSHDSHTDTQQTFRFMGLPKELRDIIYSLALQPDTEKTQTGKPPGKPQLIAGLSNSTTARALSQVCRTVRQESMKTYCSETTFVVRKLPDRVSARIRRWTDGGNPAAPGPDPLDMWARTWDELGAQHIRSLYISPLKGTVRISMVDEANTVSFDEEARANLSVASELESSGLEVYGMSGTTIRNLTAARKVETLLRKAGSAWHLARRKEALVEIRRSHPNSEVCINAICKD
jgi:hypothetical protein